MTSYDWGSFPRVPDEAWTQSPLGDLALKYDTVENHGWYSNLERTVEQLAEFLSDGDLACDYSGGTGILVDRLRQHLPELSCGYLIADSSPKFLRLALEKLGDDERVGFRLISYLKPEKRLQLLTEVLPEGSLPRPVDALVSTNAIHLYYDLEDTLKSWRAVLRPGGRVFIQSGNLRNPEAADDERIIDETVHGIAAAAEEIVRSDDRFAAYRDVTADKERMAAHDRLREKFFLPVRDLSHYTDALEASGFTMLSTERRRIEAKVDDWYEFLAAYHEGVIGWVGGSRRVEGSEPSEEAVADRLELMKLAMRETLGEDSFPCCWTYLMAEREG
ncbi:MAG: class I SAM-dependent methyltransferase [Acidobacteriota bacterium]